MCVVCGVQPPPSPPQFPKFLLRACLIGKPFSGKTAVLAQLNHRMFCYTCDEPIAHCPLVLVSELGIVVLSPSQLVEQAVQQYLSEKPVLEAQLLSISLDEDNPLVGSTNDGGNEAEGSEMIDDVFVDNGGSGGANDEENPAINTEGTAEPENGGIPVTASGDKGGGEEEEEEEEEGGEEGGGKGTTTEEASPDHDLPPYFSEVQRHHFELDHHNFTYILSLQLSAVGALGCQAYLSLCRGDQVNDQTTVAIIVEKLRLAA